MDFERARKRMVAEQVIARGINDPRVIAAMETVPRHRFVDEAMHAMAYSDKALPIGEKQTISQPYVVARAIAAAKLTGSERVLEVGAGSGYQAAILAACAKRVFSIERIPSLATRARLILEDLGIGNVVIRLADGTEGWKDQAPFDAILVAAGAPSVPQPLFDQLKEGGRMVIPLDRPDAKDGDEDGQVLTLVERRGNESVQTRLDDVVFVPLIGRHGRSG